MRTLSSISAALAALSAAPALAEELSGKPVQGGMGFQPAATELARDLQWLDGMINVIIILIVIFVCALLLGVIFFFNRRANPTPKTFTHNTPIEVAWTLGPVAILVLIGAYSLPVLFKQQEIPEGDIHIKVTGYQWYWGYEYTDHEFEFSSYMVDGAYQIDDEAAGWGADQPMSTAQVLDEVAIKKLEYFGYSAEDFLLATDTRVVVPVNKVVVMDVTAADVIHSWTIPSFGVKQDAVPGRIAQLWFKAEKEGIYHGQCSELCGKDHAYMPITVEVVSEEEYAAWLEGAIAQYAGRPASVQVAAAD